MAAEGRVSEDATGCVAVMGKDWELMICGRWKPMCEGGVTPRVLGFRLAVNEVHNDNTGCEYT